MTKDFQDTCKTFGEQFQSALACETREEAEAWMETEVTHYVEHHVKSVTEAIEIIKSNIGYMAGYYGDKEAQKIHRLFHAVHPIFGTADYHRTLTNAEAFEIGLQFGKKKP